MTKAVTGSAIFLNIADIRDGASGYAGFAEIRRGHGR